MKGKKVEKIFYILTYFLIYSFLGWVMESIFRSIIDRKIINTGFLKGPICPIYGIGAIIMFTFFKGLENNIVLLFLASIILLTLWEYIVGVLLEKIFHTKYWDYSDHKFNIQGRICLINSIYWGILGVIFVKYIHPNMEILIQKININLLSFVVIILTFVFLVDMIISIIKIKNIKATLEKIESINKEIKEKVKEIKALPKEIQEKEKIIATEKLQKLIESLKKRRNRTLRHLYKNVNRLKKAFPAIDTKEIREILNKKVEIIKRKNK